MSYQDTELSMRAVYKPDSEMPAIRNHPVTQLLGEIDRLRNEQKAFIEAEPEFPGPMPWKVRWAFLRMILTGQWAEHHRHLAKVMKASMIRRLDK